MPRVVLSRKAGKHGFEVNGLDSAIGFVELTSVSAKAINGCVVVSILPSRIVCEHCKSRLAGLDSLPEISLSVNHDEALRLCAQLIISAEDQECAPYGKTENARRRIPMTPRVKAVLDMRLSKASGCAWVFPAQTKSGHIEPSSLKKQHPKAIAEATCILREETGDEGAQLAPFELYTLRHTCLTRWAPHMDPWTLAYLAGHRDMNITKRYVHPQEQIIRAAMEKVRVEKSGHTSGHTGQTTDLETMPVTAATL